MPEDRSASTPIVGLVRQAVRILLGGLAAYLTAHIGAEDAQQIVGSLEVVAFTGVNLGLAALGKHLRDRGHWLGAAF